MSFIHMPKPVLHCALFLPPKILLKIKRATAPSKLLLPAGHPLWATCETSHLTFSYTSCSRRQVHTGSPSLPLHISLSPSKCSNIFVCYVCLGGLQTSTTLPRMARQGPRHHPASVPIPALACVVQGHHLSLPSPLLGSFQSPPTHTLI